MNSSYAEHYLVEGAAPSVPGASPTIWGQHVLLPHGARMSALTPTWDCKQSLGSSRVNICTATVSVPSNCFERGS